MDMFGTTSEQKRMERSQARSEKTQQDELARVSALEEHKLKAAQRKRGGRASLISGAETGLKDTLG